MSNPIMSSPQCTKLIENFSISFNQTKSELGAREASRIKIENHNPVFSYTRSISYVGYRMSRTVWFKQVGEKMQAMLTEHDHVTQPNTNTPVVTYAKDDIGRAVKELGHFIVHGMTSFVEKHTGKVQGA